MRIAEVENLRLTSDSLFPPNDIHQRHVPFHAGIEFAVMPLGSALRRLQYTALNSTYESCARRGRTGDIY